MDLCFNWKELLRPPETFTTQRLQLRPPRMEDSEGIFKGYSQDPDVTKFLTWYPHKSIQDTHVFLQRCVKCWENGSAFPYTILRKSDGLLIGNIEIRIELFMADLGYVLSKNQWGKGYMTEAAQVLVQWGLAQKEIYRVWSMCDVDNPASARVMEKIGMKKEGLLRRRIIHPNISQKPRDTYCYSVVK